MTVTLLKNTTVSVHVHAMAYNYNNIKGWQLLTVSRFFKYFEMGSDFAKVSDCKMFVKGQKITI